MIIHLKTRCDMANIWNAQIYKSLNISTKRPYCLEWLIFMLSYLSVFWVTIIDFSMFWLFFILNYHLSSRLSGQKSQRCVITCLAVLVIRVTRVFIKIWISAIFFFLGQEAKDKRRHCHLFDFSLIFATNLKKYKMD